MKLFPVLFFLACGVAAFMAAAAKADAALDGYITSAVAAEQCGAPSLTLLQEIMLAQLIKHRTGGALSSVNISNRLVVARAALPVDCASPAVVAQVREFTDTVRPILDSPFMSPALAVGQ